MELNYIITECGPPNSFDPLDADKTNNITSMRMLYLTPIEIGMNSNLQSNILSSFDYDPVDCKIRFIVKDGLIYEDGSEMTAYDVALSIVRASYFRPDFPVIKDILGIKKWSGEKSGLNTFPEGLELNKNKITISLKKASSNPLFRFCLELFAIIPAKCIDLDSGILLCSRPPSSGYFELLNQSGDKISFIKREQATVHFFPINYEKINFQFLPISEVGVGLIPINTIICTTELDYISSSCKDHITKDQTHWMPSSRFGVLRFNSNIKPFDKNRNRQIFAEEVRIVLSATYPDLNVQRGIIPNLLPGFIPSELLVQKFSEADRNELEGETITFPKKYSPSFHIIYKSLISAAENLKFKINYIENTNVEELVNLFINDKLGVVIGASGFWAQDPAGDISMWFTPNLHKTMTFVWQDKEIYRMLDELENLSDGNSLDKKLTEFNRYVSIKSVIVPILHFRRLYILNSIIKELNLPQAITSPAPWQIIIN